MTTLHWENIGGKGLEQRWAANGGQGRAYYISKEGHSYGLYVVVDGATTSLRRHRTWRGAVDRAERVEIGLRASPRPKASAIEEADELINYLRSDRPLTKDIRERIAKLIAGLPSS